MFKVWVQEGSTCWEREKLNRSLEQKKKCWGGVESNANGEEAHLLWQKEEWEQIKTDWEMQDKEFKIL